jgi:hypothetical protein
LIQSYFSSHIFFGLEFRFDPSLARRVPSFFGPGRPAHVAVSTSLAENPPDDEWRVLYRDSEFAIADHSRDGWLRIRYTEGPTFDIRSDGSEVRAWPVPGTSLEDLANAVLGPISGILLYLRGTTCLHASAIAHHGRALVFVGAAEAGKSTLAAAFARKRHRVLTDDVLALEQRDGDLFVQPAIPRIGLWPDSVQHLWGDSDALPRQTETWDKRSFDLLPENLFQRTALPIGTVYVLADREPNAAPLVVELNGTDAVLALIANKYVTRFSEREQEKREFALLSQLAATVPIRRITRNDALSDLDATCEAILADYDALALSPA